MARKGKWTIFILLAVGGVVFAEWFMKVKNEVAGEVIRLSGNIEVTDAEVSFKIGGRVKERRVKEGETVRAGQTVARLESEDQAHEVEIRRSEVRAAEADLAELLAGSRPEEIAQAEAAVEKARAALDELLAGSRPEEIAASEATVQRAKADMENLAIELKRYKKLFEDGVVSAETYDKARTNFKMAQAQVRQTEELLRMAREGPRKEDIDQARAALREVQERYALIKKGPRKEKIDQARARLEKAKASLALAQTQLGYTQVVSPLSGVVLSENIEPGEYVVPGTPVVTVADLGNVWVRGYINETDLGRVKVGQTAQVTSDTYPGKVYSGVVSFIASQAEFTPKNVQTEKERVKLVYRVKVDIRNPNMELKPGMPVDVEIFLTENTS
ncbi:MAG: efflux RND transporter periplasmic adaptor subunit [Nitrospinaceae bacterium]